MPTEVDKMIAGCCEQKPDAQKALVLKYSGLLLSVARRYQYPHIQAEDVLQESWILILKYIKEFRNESSSFEAWMKRIVINTALKQFRKSYVNKELTSEIFDDQKSDIPDVYSHFGFEEIISLLKKLPPGIREVFNLYIFENWKHEEIAIALNIAPSTSRAMLTKVRIFLKQEIMNLKNELERI